MAGVELVQGPELHAQRHPVTEPRGHRLREPLVAAGDPVAGQRLERRGVREDLRTEPVRPERGGDLDASQHGLRLSRRKTG